MDVICATLNSRMYALKHSRYKAGHLFEGSYLGAIMENAKIAKNTSYAEMPISIAWKNEI